MKLKEYLKNNETTMAKFASAVGVTQPCISLISNGRRRPEPELARKIEKATNGAVTFRELLLPDEQAN